MSTDPTNSVIESSTIGSRSTVDSSSDGNNHALDHERIRYFANMTLDELYQHWHLSCTSSSVTSSNADNLHPSVSPSQELHSQSSLQPTNSTKNQALEDTHQMSILDIPNVLAPISPSATPPTASAISSTVPATTPTVSPVSSIIPVSSTSQISNIQPTRRSLRKRQEIQLRPFTMERQRFWSLIGAKDRSIRSTNRWSSPSIPAVAKTTYKSSPSKSLSLSKQYSYQLDNDNDDDDDDYSGAILSDDDDDDDDDTVNMFDDLPSDTELDDLSIIATQPSIRELDHVNDSQTSEDSDTAVPLYRKRRRFQIPEDSDDDEQQKQQQQQEESRIVKTVNKETPSTRIHNNATDIFDIPPLDPLPLTSGQKQHQLVKPMITYKRPKKSHRSRQRLGTHSHSHRIIANHNHSSSTTQRNNSNTSTQGSRDVFDFVPLDDLNTRLESDHHHDMNGSIGNGTNLEDHEDSDNDVIDPLIMLDTIGTEDTEPSSSTTILGTTQSARSGQSKRRNRGSSNNMDDNFIVDADDERVHRRRNTTLNELRRSKKSLNGILPHSFLKVYSKYLEMEEYDRHWGSRNRHKSSTNKRKSLSTQEARHDDEDDFDANSIHPESTATTTTTTKATTGSTLTPVYHDDNSNNATDDLDQEYQQKEMTFGSFDDDDGEREQYQLETYNHSEDTCSLSLRTDDNNMTPSTTTTTTTTMMDLDDDDGIAGETPHEPTLEQQQEQQRWIQDEFTIDCGVASLRLGAVCGDALNFISDDQFSIFELNNPSCDSVYVFDQPFYKTDYYVDSPKMVSFFYKAFQSFYCLWQQHQQQQNDSSTNTISINKSLEKDNRTGLRLSLGFLRFVSTCLSGKTFSTDENNSSLTDHPISSMIQFLLGEMDILLDRMLTVIGWNDDTGLAEPLDIDHPQHSAIIQYILLSLIYCVDWAFRLQRLSLVANESTMDWSIKTTIRRLLFFLFSLGPSSASIGPPATYVVNVREPLVMEAWVLTLQVINNENMDDSILWSSLQDYLKTISTEVTDNGTWKSMTLWDKHELTWHWILTLITLRQLQKTDDGVVKVVTYSSPSDNTQFCQWDLIRQIFKEIGQQRFMIEKENDTTSTPRLMIADTTQTRLFYVLTCIRIGFCRCHLLLMRSQWDDKTIQQLYNLIQWQGLQLFTGDPLRPLQSRYQDHETASQYFPVCFTQYDGNVMEDQIKTLDTCGVIFWKMLAVGLHRKVNKIITNTDDKEHQLKELERCIARISPSYLVVVGPTLPLAHIISKPLSSSIISTFQHPDPFIAFAYHYAVNIIIMHATAQLGDNSMISKSNIVFQSKLETQKAWAQQIIHEVSRIYGLIKKKWGLH
ncbi:uncharacterized protein BX664DRAFT_335866 [Halteromyces radiatus]|uniref:uncharacterized protein n=1 Tax=Halteromyces radiatus TaxID=101107 RepID=UPI00221ECE89|nr:uncharacterized protein BX664DRAFT_335866 [Halteromyces radiatus]KAI8086466.1 hypothetical protein BX664DRAFT_335866 [Halteromyces radiatus]